MKTPFLLLFLLNACVISAQDQVINPLQDALWEGTVWVDITGVLQGQYLSNKFNKEGNPTGFIKEKGKLDLNYHLVFQFQVNQLGEVSLLANETLKGERNMNRQLWRQFLEDIRPDDSTVSSKQMVKISENNNRRHAFDASNTYISADELNGSFRILPSGRMDRKGVIEIQAELITTFKSRGSQTESWERQPPYQDPEKLSKTTKNKRSTIEYAIPLKFDVTISHRKKAMAGSVAVTTDLSSPFDFILEKGEKPTLHQKVAASGHYKLKPLFKSK